MLLIHNLDAQPRLYERDGDEGRTVPVNRKVSQVDFLPSSLSCLSDFLSPPLLLLSILKYPRASPAPREPVTEKHPKISFERVNKLLVHPELQKSA